MSGQPYAVRFSPLAAKVLAELPEHAEQMVWDLLDVAAADPWGFRQWNPADPEGADVRIASVGRLSVIYFANNLLAHLSVLHVVWLGSIRPAQQRPRFRRPAAGDGPLRAAAGPHPALRRGAAPELPAGPEVSTPAARSRCAVSEIGAASAAGGASWV